VTAEGYRWCTSGTCGRLLPLTEFHRVGAGRWSDSRCKMCHRMRERLRYRRKAKSPAFRAAEAARKFAAYHAQKLASAHRRAAA
jgi:hypothetical protein